MKFQNSLLKSLLILAVMRFGFVVVAQEAIPNEKTNEVAVKLKPTGNYAAAMSGACEKACGLQKYDPTAMVDQLDAEIGDITRCIVSGVAIKIRENTSTVSYKGQKFFTCCATCEGFFEKDPERFLQ